MTFFIKVFAMLCLFLNFSVWAKNSSEEQWVQLFDGKTLNGWQPKFAGKKLGDNYKNTFRVENGLLSVNYDRYEKFDEEYGHLFYQTPYSHYILRSTYRFLRPQLSLDKSMAWAFRNNGFMIHAQPPETMTIEQKFPTSIEVQLLGGTGEGERTTGNICTPDSDVVIDGKLVTDHCIYSTSKTFHGDQWVTIEIEVRGDKVIKHKVNDELVFEYTKPQLDSKSEALHKLYNGKAMTSGYIAIQAETHPTQFKSISIKVLSE